MQRMHAYILCSAICLMAADWRQFRGNDSTGIAAADHLPVQFGPKDNLAWQVPLPGRGPSSPLVVDGRVIVTASTGAKQDRLLVLSYDAATSAKQWERTFWATGPTDCHPKTTMAAPSPVSDGHMIVALFATDDLICLDLKGNVLWLRALHEENPGATDGRGLSSSPLLIDGVVVVQIENQNTSFATGIDATTGKSLWRIDRPRLLCWSSPITLPGKNGHPLVLLQGSSRLSAIDPRTGSEMWGLNRHSDEIASSLLQGNVLFVPGEQGLAAFDLGAGEGVPIKRWEKPKLSPTTASPLLMNGALYTLRGAMLVRADPLTGEAKGQCRLKGSFSASLIGAGGLIYCCNEAGTVLVVKPGEKEDVVAATADLGDTVLATPAVANNALYIRGEKYLWKFAKQ
ncbi:MAG TPA: PQQ-binding-like beta-propeller repeat protein [Gemmataceae bacterium]|nr:PQQ-binding-like beta-propeller repeat protein [Gemmataceae bacterium]